LREGFEKEKRFTADAAHELRTPLAALSAQIQVALREETPEGRNRALLKVLAGVNRSTHVIQQLLTLSRMDPEASIQDPQAVNLAQQAAEVAAQLAPEAIAKNIELELLNPDSKASIMGNPTAIHILLRNLVDNAIRYSPENSFVKINIEENNNEVILTVMDNGPGIPEELRERVFERFFRVSGTKTTGSGLGLGIVMQIVKLHKAKIELLTPAHSHGLTVKITFKRA
jgi:two-component system sensor histidine kinase QseC